MFEYFEKTPEAGDANDTNNLLGAQSTTLRDWLNLKV